MVRLVILLVCFLKVSIVENTSPNPSIIIVGSGSSGIAAATKLLKNNFTNIKILEAENRIGGRINSVTFGDAYVDLGAQYCDGEKDNVVYSLVKDLKILRPSNKNEIYLVSNGEIVNKKLTEKIINFAVSLEATNKAHDDCRNVTSVGDCLTIRSEKLINDVVDAKEKEILALTPDLIKAYLNTIDSPLDLNDLSIVTEGKMCEGEQHLNWNGLGFKTILEIMMQKYPTIENQLPIDDKIFLQKEVTSISNWQSGEKVTVITTDNSTYEADHVIFTPSVGVLKANHQTLFNPSLPEEKVNAIKNIGFGATLKIFMHFSQRWWTDYASWAFLWTKEDKTKLKEKNLDWLITLTGIVQYENNPKVLVGSYGGSYVPLIETLSEEEILQGQKYIINTFLAPHFNVTMPDNIIRTTWYSNPHFRGAYSYESVKGHSTGGKNFQNKLAKPLLNQHDNPTVLFAGEATHPYYFGNVHGAIDSGYTEAQRLINLYKNNTRNVLQNLM